MNHNRHNVHPKDILIETFNTGGNWIQNQDGVKVTHLPSGEVFTSQESRSQMLNRNHCLNQLETFLDTWEKPKEIKKPRYLIPAVTRKDAIDIARTYGLGPTDFIHVHDKMHLTPEGLPK